MKCCLFLNTLPEATEQFDSKTKYACLQGDICLKYRHIIKLKKKP